MTIVPLEWQALKQLDANIEVMEAANCVDALTLAIGQIQCVAICLD